MSSIFIRILTIIVLSGIIFSLNISAQMRPNHEGYFDVRSADTVLVEQKHMLDARLQLFLSDEALNALNSGVSLTIELNIELLRIRRFLPDDKETELSFQYELEYSPLSQRYIVRDVGNASPASSSTLFSALHILGRIQHLFLFVSNSLIQAANYRSRLTALLSANQ